MQVAVNHQLVVVTETYKFHNDGKSAADALLLCSTRDYAEAQAYQEVPRLTAEVSLLSQSSRRGVQSTLVCCR